MESEREQNILETAKITQLIRKFSIPAIMSSVVGSVYNIVDQIFIGQKLGTAGNAATNVAFPMVMLMVAFAMTIGTGGSSRFSLHMGRKENENAGQIMGNSLSCLLISGILLAVITLIFLHPMMLFFGARGEILELSQNYTGITAIGIPFYVVGTGFSMFIRADGRPGYAMICTILGAVCNTILDPIFIFGLDWGIRGAALATILGQMISAVGAVLYLRDFQSCKINRTVFRLRKKIVKDIFILGLPSGLTQLTVMAVQIVMNNTLGYYGAQTVYGREIPLACAGIVSKVSSIFNSVIMGISQSCQPIFGHNYGAENYRRVKKTYKTAAVIATGIAVTAFLLFQLFPIPILKIFGSGDQLYLQFGSRYLRIYMFCIFISGIQILTSNFFPAIGKAKQGILLSLSRQAFLQVPLLVILPCFFGINGVLYAGAISDGLAGILAAGMAVQQMKKLNAEE
jgi:Na+-driven multidrug efflux pump